MAEPQSSLRQPARTVRQVASTNAPTHRFTISPNLLSVTVSNVQPAEPSRLVTNRTPSHRQTMHIAPNLASKQFVPHRVREVPTIQDVSPNTLENPDLTEDSRLPSQQPATVADPRTLPHNSPKPKPVR